uniref:RNA-directed DNA polymerase n=1 Tax=Lygus hesperus TaxID=30085 RepID=A0A146LZ17_LYGHE
MDPEQFKIFMKEMRSWITELKGEKKAVEVSGSLVHISPFENFDPNKEKFSCYIERFGNYCNMKNLKDDSKKAQLLLGSIGSTHYNALTAYLGPDKPITQLDYASLTTSFDQMLTPKRSVIVSQHYFLSIIQKESQSIAEFVAALQRDIADCDFKVECTTSTCKAAKTVISVNEIFLRAQFIRGLRDNWIREQLLQSTEHTFDKILSKAVALEAARIESAELSKRTPNPGSSDICRITQPRRNSRHDSNNNNKPHNNRQRSSPRFENNRSRSVESRNRSRNRIDYRALGIQDLCTRCARNNHKVADCRVDYDKAHCTSCNRKGHVSRVCITTLSKNLKSNRSGSTNSVTHVEDEHAYGISRLDTEIIDLFEVFPDTDKYIVTVLINGKPQRMEVDSGARFSLLSEEDFNKLNLNLPIQPSETIFRSYSGNMIRPRGKVVVKVAYKDKETHSDLFIVPTGHAALLGRQWIRDLGIELKEIDHAPSFMSKTPTINVVVTPDDIVAEFPSVFSEKIGCVPNFEVKLQLRQGAKPSFTRERHLPYALRTRVEEELDSLEAAGIISPVTTSDWCSPLVVIPKADGGVRLCVDYKAGVNERLISASFPIRKIEDVLHSLRGSRYFCKIDLFKAYLHLKVCPNSALIQTIGTHRGMYTMNRLSFGIKTAPAEFNRIISQVLHGLPKCEAYFDDIICHGATSEECAKNLRACLKRLSEYDLHVNRNKCSFFEKKIEYLGHIIEHNQIRKSPDKIRAVDEMQRPTDADGVRRFLGLLTYYSRFIPQFSSLSCPLRRLLKNNQKFSWTADCEAAFLKLKAELCSDRVLVPFDPSLPVILTCDASPDGVASVLSHSVGESEKPIAYASRSLTASETNYSQLDREALAIVFGVNHFYNYLYGRPFTLVTDNQPLTRIFQHNKNLPQMTSARLLRYASFLSGFDYQVKFKSGEENKNVDCLSRAPISQTFSSTDTAIGEEVNLLYAEQILQISSYNVTFKVIQEETSKDPELAKIIKSLKNECKDSEYTIHEGTLFRRDRIFIPASLRSQVLSELHESHLGIQKMKQLARRYVYWPGIDSQIERLVKGCEQCALTRADPPKLPVHPWDQPSENWERLHIDYAGPFQGYHFLVCVDAKSKWAEVEPIKNAPTTASTIALLDKIFATHGYPNHLVSDNATIFQSEEFHQYCRSSGIFQKFIAPGHPATNGLAERNVQTLKNKLRAASDENIPMHDKIRKIMFHYRATPLACGKSPAELYLKRKFRTRLDAFFPVKPHAAHSSPSAKRFFHVGERVQIRIFKGNKPIWEFGEVMRRFGQRHYLVRLDSSGRTLKRHINQLRDTRVQPKRIVSFGPTQSFGVPSFPKYQGVKTPQNQSSYRRQFTGSATHHPGHTPPRTPALPGTPPTPRRPVPRPVRVTRLPERLRDPDVILY